MLPALGGLLGLLLGSFLNVCSLRWPQDQSVVSPPSRCPHCERGIRWYENVPVLGWVFLGGKCRGCQARISVQYPMVELATGLIWAAMVWQHGLEWEALRGALFLTILLGIAASDARFYIIPDEFSIGGTVLGLILAFAPGGIEIWEAALGAVVWSTGLWAVGKLTTLYLQWRSPERLDDMGVGGALGFGDVKMMAMVGAFIGLWGGALTLFLGSVIATLTYPIVLKLAKGLIPFGIYLAAGAAAFSAWVPKLLAS